MIKREIAQRRGFVPTLLASTRWAAVTGVIVLKSVSLSGSPIAETLSTTEEHPQTHIEGYLVLHVDIEYGITGSLYTISDSIRRSLRGAKIGYVGLGVVEDRIVFEVRNLSQGEEAEQLVKGYWPKMGVLRTESSFEVFFEQKDLPRIRHDTLVQTLNSIRAYMLGSGIDVDGVRVQGPRCILIPTPAADQLKKLKQNLRSKRNVAILSIDKSIDPDRSDIPSGFMVLEPYKETYGETLSRYVVRRRIVLSGQHIVDASVTMANGQSVIVITLDFVGEQIMLRKLWDSEQELAIALDHKFLAIVHANRRQPDRITVHGDVTSENAKEIAAILRGVPNPAPVSIVDSCAE